MSACYDFCFVGSGPASAFAANELANKGYSVVVVEAGNLNLNSNINENVDVKNSNFNGSIDFGFSNQIGGSSNLWAGGLAKMDMIDLVARPKFNFLKWPIEHDELLELYKRVNKIINLNLNQFADDSFFKKSKDLVGRKMILMDKPFNTKNLICDISNILLLQNHSAYKLHLTEFKDSISFLESIDRDSHKSINIKAKNYILGAGSINNIRLLLHSLEDIKDDREIFYNQIGRYFSTHPKGNLGKITFKNSEDLFTFLEINHSFNSTYRYQIGFKKSFLEKNDLLNHSIRIESTLALRTMKAIDFVKKLLTKIKFLRKNTKFLNFLSKIGVVVYQVVERLKPAKKGGNYFVVRGFFDQKSSMRNRVYLSEKKSSSGLPLAIINWDFNSNDWKNVETFLDKLQQELLVAEIGALEINLPKGKEFTGIHSHFIGGTRVGSSETESVVNENLKVHGFKNLYVSGPSVFPSFGYANPFYTIAALSLRLSDHLADKEKKSSIKNENA